jgi:hypothetical protein
MHVTALILHTLFGLFEFESLKRSSGHETMGSSTHAHAQTWASAGSVTVDAAAAVDTVVVAVAAGNAVVAAGIAVAAVGAVAAGREAATDAVADAESETVVAMATSVVADIAALVVIDGRAAWLLSAWATT